MKNNNYIHHTPYLRNSLAYDHDFWYTCVKWYLQVCFFFPFFLNFKRFCLLHFISRESYIIWWSFMVHLCEIIIFPGIFFHFFKILIFWVVRGVKGQKMVQNEKKLCLLRSISQETYIIWFSFMVHMCKMIISMAIFFIFSEFWCSRLLGG